LKHGIKISLGIGLSAHFNAVFRAENLAIPAAFATFRFNNDSSFGRCRFLSIKLEAVKYVFAVLSRSRFLS
jgi:hypothetical protein